MANSPNILEQAQLSLIHDFNQKAAMVRAGSAKSQQLDNAGQYGAPFPGSNSTTIQQGISLPALITTVLGILSALGGGFAGASWLAKPTAAPAAIAAPALPAAPTFDPNQYEFRVVPPGATPNGAQP